MKDSVNITLILDQYNKNEIFNRTKVQKIY